MTTTITSTPWQITGSENLPLFGNTHLPCDTETPRAAIIMTHGFLGYKDYGLFPFLAQSLADNGFICHRYNLAHSGMTNNIESFEHPDLFEKDTWNHQVSDINAVIAAVQSGKIAGEGLPLILWGHSRGGVSSLLTLGRHFLHHTNTNSSDDSTSHPAGLITVSAPSATTRISTEIREQIKAQGYLEVTSGRTGQTMRINRNWLDEIEADPDHHDVLKMASHIQCPVLAIHGEEDPTVDSQSASEIAQAVKRGGAPASYHLIPGANHVFNTTNPMPQGSEPSTQLQELIKSCIEFAGRVAESS